jgi:hypothetical protein
MSMDTRDTTSTAEALTLLLLPAIGDLSEQQVRGITCVWDGVALSPTTAVNLGPRTFNQLGEKRQWYPRACRQCLLHHFYNHVDGCAECTANAAGCELGAAMRRAALRAGR